MQLLLLKPRRHRRTATSAERDFKKSYTASAALLKLNCSVSKWHTGTGVIDEQEDDTVIHLLIDCTLSGMKQSLIIGYCWKISQTFCKLFDTEKRHAKNKHTSFLRLYSSV